MSAYKPGQAEVSVFYVCRKICCVAKKLHCMNVCRVSTLQQVFLFDILKKTQSRKNSKLKRFLMKTQKPVSIINEKKMLKKLNKSFNNLV